jgi:hypothetical protein
VPLCWTEEEQGIRRKNCDRPEPREAGNSLRGCLQEQMSGQAGNLSYEGRAEASKGHREGRDTEERDKGGTEKRQTSLEERAGRTAPHKEGAQEVARLREAELHQLVGGGQGQPGDKDGIHPSDVEMINEMDPPPREEYGYVPHTLSTEVIFETQLIPSNRSKGSIYNDILASIGLDSPTPSHETRRGEDSNTSPRAQLINTPIRNSASSLIALGKHVLTPR